MVVIGHRDPLPGSPGSTVRLDRSISRGSDARPARSFGDLTGRYSLIEQQKDALAAEQGQGRKMPFPKRPSPNGSVRKRALSFKALAASHVGAFIRWASFIARCRGGFF